MSHPKLPPLSLVGLATGSTTLTPAVALLALQTGSSASTLVSAHPQLLPLPNSSTMGFPSSNTSRSLPQTSATLAADTPHPQPATAVDLPDPIVPLHSELAAWCEANELARSSDPTPGRTLEFEGMSVGTVATALLDFLVYSHAHPLREKWSDWQAPEGIQQFTIFSVDEYLRLPVRLFQAYVTHIYSLDLHVLMVNYVEVQAVARVLDMQYLFMPLLG